MVQTRFATGQGHVYPLDVFKQDPGRTVGAEGNNEGRR